METGHSIRLLSSKGSVRFRVTNVEPSRFECGALLRRRSGVVVHRPRRLLVHLSQLSGPVRPFLCSFCLFSGAPIADSRYLLSAPGTALWCGRRPGARLSVTPKLDFYSTRRLIRIDEPDWWESRQIVQPQSNSLSNPPMRRPRTADQPSETWASYPRGSVSPSQQAWFESEFYGFVRGYYELAPLIDEEPCPNTICCPSIILRVLRAA